MIQITTYQLTQNADKSTYHVDNIIILVNFFTAEAFDEYLQLDESEPIIKIKHMKQRKSSNEDQATIMKIKQQ